MYNNLVNNYNYLDENIYLHFWGHKKGYKDNIYIDGPATWDVVPISQGEWGIGIKNSLTELRIKMTKNDFFCLFGTSHGGMTEKKGVKGTGTLQTYNWYTEDDTIVGVNTFVWYNYPGQEKSLAQNIDNLHYARAVIVVSACGSGTAIHGTDERPEWNLKDKNRIIMTSSDKNEYSYCEMSSNCEHMAFLYEGRVDYLVLPDEYHPMRLIKDTTPQLTIGG
ncbi:MAG: hypothetical protein QMC98_00635 [Candidatus Thermoplasmatota archaeon]|nr:hypothetical protein [Candidatus Thermoplasmatota archaeon]